MQKLTREQAQEKLSLFNTTLIGEYTNSTTYTNFRCEVCNIEFESNYINIVNSNTKKCACGKFRKHFLLLQKMESGEKIGILTIIKPLGVRKKKIGNEWLLQCDCGNEIEVPESDLMRTQRIIYQSCGCLNKGKNSPHWQGYEEISGMYWQRIQNGAKKRHFQFDLDIKFLWDKFIEQDKKCALSGRELCFGRNQTASLDRKNSMIGYFNDNVQWVHRDINRMKLAFDQEYFLGICKDIANYNC